MKFRSFYIILYVAAIGLFISFALCRGDKTELNYYDFAELTIYKTRIETDKEYERYSSIGLDEEKRNELKTIMEDFDLSRFLDNPYDFGSEQVIIKYYYFIITIQNEPYLLEIEYRGDSEENTFNLDKIINNDRRFCYTNRKKLPTATFEDKELSKEIGRFIRENKNLIDGKMSNIEQEQPKYSSPMIQRIHERYGETVEWFEDRYYEYTHP